MLLRKRQWTALRPTISSTDNDRPWVVQVFSPPPKPPWFIIPKLPPPPSLPPLPLQAQGEPSFATRIRRPPRWAKGSLNRSLSKPEIPSAEDLQACVDRLARGNNVGPEPNSDAPSPSRIALVEPSIALRNALNRGLKRNSVPQIGPHIYTRKLTDFKEEKLLIDWPRDLLPEFKHAAAAPAVRLPSGRRNKNRTVKAFRGN